LNPFDLPCNYKVKTRFQILPFKCNLYRYIKVWMSYAQFEAAPMAAADEDEEEDGEGAEAAAARRAAAAAAAEEEDPEEALGARTVRARGVYERALRSLKVGLCTSQNAVGPLASAWFQPSSPLK
jgi:crooked neck